MSGKRAKRIKRQILKAIYGDEILEKSAAMKHERRKVYATSKFFRIYKAAKRNWRKFQNQPAT